MNVYTFDQHSLITQHGIMKRSFLSLVLIASALMQAFGQGAYIEYKMTSEKNNISGTVKTYSLDGNSRTEIALQMPSMPGGGINVITIIKKDAPDTVYMLNEKNKSFSATANTKDKANDDEEYEITILGKEKVNGYNSTHIKVHYKKANKDGEMWTSKEVADYAFYSNVKNKYLDGNKLYAALTAKGVEGFPVRINVNEGNRGNVQLDLVKVEKQKVDPSIFSVDGYTRTAGVNPEDMKAKMQNMTPEERQKYIDQLKQQYLQQQQPH